MTDVYCKNCKFWVLEEATEPVKEEGQISMCHRFPPMLRIQDDYYEKCESQPWTYDTDWCGEWEER